MKARSITRREMLKLMGVGAAGMVASAMGGCKAKTPPPPTETPVPSVTPAPSPTAGTAKVTVGKIAATIEEGQAMMGTYQEWHPTSPVTLTAWFPTGPETDPWLMAANAVMDRFEKKYPEIKVNREPQPADLDAKVSAALASGEGPDLIPDSDREAQYPRDKVVRPIPEEVLPISWVKEHKFFEVRPLTDGLLYALHGGIYGPVLFVNKALLAEKGYKPADTPKKWEDFAKFCQELTKSEGGQTSQVGYGFNGYARYMWDDMIYQQKGHVYNQTKSFLDSAESQNAWQMIVDFYDKYKINDRNFLAFDAGFGTGKAAYAPIWTWFINPMEANYPDIDWTVVTYPTFTGEPPYGRVDYDTASLWLVSTFAKGDREKAAWEVFKYLSYDYQWIVDRYRLNGLALFMEPHPDYGKLFTEVMDKANPTQADRKMQALAVMSQQAEGGMVFPGEVAGPFDSMWQKLEEAILVNNTPIKDACAQYTKDFDDMLSKTHFWITPEA